MILESGVYPLNDFLFYILLLLFLPFLGFVLNTLVVSTRILQERVGHRFAFAGKLSSLSKQDEADARGQEDIADEILRPEAK